LDASVLAASVGGLFHIIQREVAYWPIPLKNSLVETVKAH
jgi:hypothetical protein